MNVADIASSGVLAAAAAGVTFAGGVLGMVIGGRIPDRIMSPLAQDVLKLIIGFMATLSALVFSLLINSANNFSNTQRAALESLAARALQLDRDLEQYGPEAKPGRDLLKGAMIESYNKYWGQETADTVAPKVDETPVNDRSVTSFFATLQPTTDIQRRILARAFDTATSLGASRLLISIQVSGTVSSPFGAILVSWVSLLFLGFGIMGRGLNLAIAAGIAAGAFAIGSAAFLILELSQPYAGLLRISPAPLLQAIEAMGR